MFPPIYSSIRDLFRTIVTSWEHSEYPNCEIRLMVKLIKCRKWSTIAIITYSRMQQYVQYKYAISKWPLCDPNKFDGFIRSLHLCKPYNLITNRTIATVCYQNNVHSICRLHVCLLPVLEAFVYVRVCFLVCLYYGQARCSCKPTRVTSENNAAVQRHGLHFPSPSQHLLSRSKTKV